MTMVTTWLHDVVQLSACVTCAHGKTTVVEPWSKHGQNTAIELCYINHSRIMVGFIPFFILAKTVKVITEQNHGSTMVFWDIESMI